MTAELDGTGRSMGNWVDIAHTYDDVVRSTVRQWREGAIDPDAAMKRLQTLTRELECPDCTHGHHADCTQPEVTVQTPETGWPLVTECCCGERVR